MTEPIPFTSRREAARAGVIDVLPMFVGIVPFGLVAGAAPVADGLGAEHAIGLSTLVFAGASQLATAEVLTSGGGVLVAAITAWAINLRLLLYSASLAPYLAHEPRRRRALAAYLLVDQAYAFAISRWDHDPPHLRLPYFLAQGGLLWINWQICTVLGVVLGSQVPDDIPIDFAAPLVFLVLLVPAVNSRPAFAAAVAAGSSAVTARLLGAANLSVAVGCVAGITVGTLVSARLERAEIAGAGS